MRDGTLRPSLLFLVKDNEATLSLTESMSGRSSTWSLSSLRSSELLSSELSRSFWENLIDSAGNISTVWAFSKLFVLHLETLSEESILDSYSPFLTLSLSILRGDYLRRGPFTLDGESGSLIPVPGKTADLCAFRRGGCFLSIDKLAWDGLT